MVSVIFFFVVAKAKPNHLAKFPSVLIGMLGSTIPVSIIGIRFAMSVEPFWKPEQYSGFLFLLDAK